MNLFSLYAELGLKDDGYRKGIKDATSSGKNFASGLVSSVSAGTIALGNLMADAVKAGVSVVKNFGSQAITYAAEVEAANAQFEAAFGDMADEATAAFAKVGKETNILTSRLKETGTKGFSQLKGAGLDANKAMEASTKLLELSADAAAYYDISLEDANEKLRSFMRGNTEAGDAIGLFTSESQRNSAAVEEYGKKWDKLTEAQKQLLMLNIADEIYSQSGAMGQAAREGESWGNVTANAQEIWRQTLALMGGPIKDQLIPIIQSFTEFLSNNQTAISGVAEGIGSLMGKAVEVSASLGTAFGENGISGVLDIISTKVSEASTKVTEALPGLIESVTTWATEKKTEMLTSATDLFAGFSEAIPGVTEKVTEALPGILTAVTTFVVGNKIQMATEATTLFSGFSESLTTAITGLSEALPGIVTAVTDFVVEQAPVVLAQATTLFAGLSDSVSTAITNIGTSLPGIIDNFVTTVTENLPRLLELGGTMVGEIISGVIGAIPQILVAGVGFASTLVSSIKKYDWLSIGGDIIAGLLGGIQTAASASLEAIKQAFVDIWTGIKGVFGIASPSTVAAEAGSFIVEGLSNGITTGVATFGETIKSAFKGIWEGIKSIFGFGKEKDTSGEDAEAVGTTIVEGLATGLGGEENSAVTNAASLGTRIIEAIKTALDITENVSNMAVTIGGAVTAGVDQGAQDAQITGMNTVAMNVFEGLVSAMAIKGGVAGYFTSVGAAISQGIAKGIKDSASSITSAAKEAARAAYNAAMRELDAHSPSRKMMEVGKYYAEGFALGISGNTGTVAAAARNAAQQAVYGSYMGDVNVTQNISAVAMSPNELAMQTANALQLLRFA